MTAALSPVPDEPQAPAAAHDLAEDFAARLHRFADAQGMSYEHFRQVVEIFHAVVCDG